MEVEEQRVSHCALPAPGPELLLTPHLLSDRKSLTSKIEKAQVWI